MITYDVDYFEIDHPHNLTVAIMHLMRLLGTSVVEGSEVND